MLVLKPKEGESLAILSQISSQERSHSQGNEGQAKRLLGRTIQRKPLTTQLGNNLLTKKQFPWCFSCHPYEGRSGQTSLSRLSIGPYCPFQTAPDIRPLSPGFSYGGITVPTPSVSSCILQGPYIRERRSFILSNPGKLLSQQTHYFQSCKH